MKIRAVNEVKLTYRDWFCDDMSKEAVHIAMDVTSLEQLESRLDDISAGEYDAIEAELRGIRR